MDLERELGQIRKDLSALNDKVDNLSRQRVPFHPMMGCCGLPSTEEQEAIRARRVKEREEAMERIAQECEGKVYLVLGASPEVYRNVYGRSHLIEGDGLVIDLEAFDRVANVIFPTDFREAALSLEGNGIRALNLGTDKIPFYPDKHQWVTVSEKGEGYLAVANRVLRRHELLENPPRVYASKITLIARGKDIIHHAAYKDAHPIVKAFLLSYAIRYSKQWAVPYDLFVKEVKDLLEGKLARRMLLRLLIPTLAGTSLENLLEHFKFLASLLDKESSESLVVNDNVELRYTAEQWKILLTSDGFPAWDHKVTTSKEGQLARWQLVRSGVIRIPTGTQLYKDVVPGGRILRDLLQDKEAFPKLTGAELAHLAAGVWENHYDAYHTVRILQLCPDKRAVTECLRNLYRVNGSDALKECVALLGLTPSKRPAVKKKKK